METRISPGMQRVEEDHNRRFGHLAKCSLHCLPCTLWVTS